MISCALTKRDRQERSKQMTLVRILSAAITFNDHDHLFCHEYFRRCYDLKIMKGLVSYNLEARLGLLTPL